MKSAPSPLAYLHPSRRQTGPNTIHKEKVRLSRRNPIPRGRSLQLSFGDYLSTNLIRIFVTKISPAMSCKMSRGHNAVAKIQIKFESLRWIFKKMWKNFMDRSKRDNVLHNYATLWSKKVARRKGVQNWERGSTSLALRDYFSCLEGVLRLSSGTYERICK